MTTPIRESQKEGSPCFTGEDPLQTELSSNLMLFNTVLFLCIQLGLSSFNFKDSSLFFVFVLVGGVCCVVVLLYNQSRCEFVCPQESHEWDGGGRCSGRPGEVSNEGERYWIDG